MAWTSKNDLVKVAEKDQSKRRVKRREIHGVFWLFFSSVYVWSPPVNSQYFKRALMGWETCRTQRCLFQSINWASLNLPICISVNIPLVKNSRFCDYEENSHMPGVLGRNKRHMRIVSLLHAGSIQWFKFKHQWNCVFHCTIALEAHRVLTEGSVDRIVEYYFNSEGIFTFPFPYPLLHMGGTMSNTTDP